MSDTSELNPRTTHFEFSGPRGALCISLGLPLLIEALFLSCNARGCPAGWSSFINQFSETRFISFVAVKAYLCWLAALLILELVVPGDIVKGTTLRTGKHLMYKFNGARVTVILFLALVFRSYSTNLELPELQFIYNHLIELANASLLFAAILSTWLYIASFRGQKLLALGGNTGSLVYDWFIGRELNPRILGDRVDLKLWLEMRPGLLLWVLIDLAMAHHQYLMYGNVTASMILVCFFQIYYVVEGTFYETGLVSMIDTTTDGLGFMLVFGDVSLVPFTYTLQTRFLADHPVELTWFAIAAIVFIYVAGIAIFRLSNNEKNRFKAGDPSTSHLKYITSESGSKLLVTGWWGKARHINYAGDWLSSWANCLPCGFTLIPYYFIVYFAALLIHREGRDEAKCAAKYGSTWDQYKKQVPYKFIPYIY